ncbi:YwgA family protein [Geomicrobium sp. JSM 1781026]|uniref:YwgA family protein n=2 Tax=unclassified Geomicrobium TaxID=2628951 RepID=UPI0035BF417E
MLTEHVNIMKLLDMAEEIVGRKKFQKVVYIGKQLGMPFQEKYGFHMYGPYSEELSVRLDELKQFGFVSEVKEEKAGYSQYRYKLAEPGTSFVRTSSSFKGKQEKSVIDEMNACSSKFLELTATILYLQPAERDSVIARVHKLKKTQNYSEEDMREAFLCIERWRTLLKRT